MAFAQADPSEVTQEALVALRKADVERQLSCPSRASRYPALCQTNHLGLECPRCRLSAHLLPGLLQLGHAERQVLLVGGQPFIEDGPLANFSGLMPRETASYCASNEPSLSLARSGSIKLGANKLIVVQKS